METPISRYRTKIRILYREIVGVVQTTKDNEPVKYAYAMGKRDAYQIAYDLIDAVMQEPTMPTDVALTTTAQQLNPKQEPDAMRQSSTYTQSLHAFHFAYRYNKDGGE